MSQQTLEILSDERIAPSLLKSDDSELIASVGSIAAVDSSDSEDSIPLVASTASADYLVPVIFGESEDFISSKDFIGSEDFIDSEAFIGSEDFIDSEAFIGSEDFIDSEDSFGSANPILFQEIEVDSLTGVPTDSTAYARGPRPKKTTALYDPRLAIKTFSYNNLAEVTATVRVELSPLVRYYVEQDLVDITLQASVWGMDGGFFGRNGHLFNFSDKLITGEGTFTFKTFVNSHVLDEDTGWLQGGPTDEIATRFTLTSSDPALPLNVPPAWSQEVSGRY